MNVKKIYALHGALSRHSLRYYLDHVVINSSPDPAAWGNVREPWQDSILYAKIPMFEALAGLNPGYVGPWSFCDILPRGHDKSSLEGRLATWLLLASRRTIHGYFLAADRDQGALILQAMRDEARLNPWVDEQLAFSRGKVEGPAGFFEVLPADAGGAFGLRGNVYICDEWTNWRKPVSHEMWKAVLSGREKVQPTILGILSNAGFFGTWQEKVWRDIQTDPDFVVYEAPGPLASWMDAARIARLRSKLGSPAEARRVFNNEWINAGEDHDYLTAAEARACIDPDLFYRLRRPDRNAPCVASIDYAPKKDRTVCLVGHAREDGTAIVDRMDVMQTVPPSAVLDWVKDVAPRFEPDEWVIDPYQMLGVIEEMRNLRLPVHEYTSRGGAGNFEIAQVLRASVANRRVLWYPGCGLELEDELAKLVTKKRPYGFRIDHTSTGHDDQAVALGMFLVRLQEFTT